jgi:hypothetical protein
MANEDKTIRDELPESFASFAELADFWDTHDLTDYPDSVTPVTFTLAEEPTHEYVVSLSNQLHHVMRQVQAREGVSVETLINLWVQEKLLQYQASF